jgi:hypothetical protein
MWYALQMKKLFGLLQYTSQMIRDGMVFFVSKGDKDHALSIVQGKL